MSRLKIEFSFSTYTKSKMSSPIELILANLAVGFGRDAVVDAAAKFCGQKKVKKERKARGPTSWNILVSEVLEEMRKTNPEATHRMAYAEAGTRKREGDPDAQAKYEERRAAKEVKRAEKAAAKVAPAAAAPAAATPAAAAPAATPAPQSAVKTLATPERPPAPVAPDAPKKRGRPAKLPASDVE